MQEKTLIQISLIVSLAGILALYLILHIQNLEVVPINEIEERILGEIVKVKGKLRSFRDTNSTMFLTLEEPSEILVVVFKTEEDVINLQEGTTVEVIGQIEEYNGNKEIIAQRMRIVR